jgi:hypothetical protein
VSVAVLAVGVCCERVLAPVLGVGVALEQAVPLVPTVLLHKHLLVVELLGRRVRALVALLRCGGGTGRGEKERMSE